MESFAKEREPARTEPRSDAVPEKPLSEIIQELNEWHQELLGIVDRGRQLNRALAAADETIRRKRDTFEK